MVTQCLRQEPILALRRQLAGLSGADVEAGLCWLQHAKLCRGTGHYEAATTASLEALARGVVGAPIQDAKLLWDMDQPHRAIIKLQQVQPSHEVIESVNESYGIWAPWVQVPMKPLECVFSLFGVQCCSGSC